MVLLLFEAMICITSKILSALNNSVRLLSDREAVASTELNVISLSASNESVSVFSSALIWKLPHNPLVALAFKVMVKVLSAALNVYFISSVMPTLV